MPLRTAGEVIVDPWTSLAKFEGKPPPSKKKWVEKSGRIDRMRERRNSKA